VEWVFRTGKSKIRYGRTMQLEMRPVHVRLASRTRGHALVIMLSYKIVQVAEGGDSTRREAQVIATRLGGHRLPGMPTGTRVYWPVGWWNWGS
jgi:hypothetical protein